MARRVVGLTEENERLPLGAEIWDTTSLVIPESQPGAEYHNVLTGERLKAALPELLASRGRLADLFDASLDPSLPGDPKGSVRLKLVPKRGSGSVARAVLVLDGRERAAGRDQGLPQAFRQHQRRGEHVDNQRHSAGRGRDPPRALPVEVHQTALEHVDVPVVEQLVTLRVAKLVGVVAARGHDHDGNRRQQPRQPIAPTPYESTQRYSTPMVSQPGRLSVVGPSAPSRWLNSSTGHVLGSANKYQAVALPASIRNLTSLTRLAVETFDRRSEVVFS